MSTGGARRLTTPELAERAEQNRQQRERLLGEEDEQQRAIRAGLAEQASLRRAEGGGRRGARGGRAAEGNGPQAEHRAAMLTTWREAQRLLALKETDRVRRDWSTPEAWSQLGYFVCHQLNLEAPQLLGLLKPGPEDDWNQWSDRVARFYTTPGGLKLPPISIRWTWWYHKGTKAPGIGPWYPY